MPKLNFERVLLVAGAQNTGKSTQLRSMFLDPRFGTHGGIPDAKKTSETYLLSPDRSLYLRLTSPHERGETLSEFINKINAKTVQGRWNVASAMQIQAEDKMPALPKVVETVIRRLRPERVRVALLSPDQHGTRLEDADVLADKLWKFKECEVLCIDSRSRQRNGFLLADTFDFA